MTKNAIWIFIVELDKDMGHYMGFRKRDILYGNMIFSGKLPKYITNTLINLNAPCQKARGEQLLLEAGYDLEKWKSELPTINPIQPE